MTTAAPANLLRVHLGEDDRFHGRPLHEEILRRCHAAGAPQAIVYRGIEGFGASTLIHRPGLFGRSKDAPIVVTVVAGEAVMGRLKPALEEIVDEGLIAISRVEVLLYEETLDVGDSKS